MMLSWHATACAAAFRARIPLVPLPVGHPATQTDTPSPARAPPPLARSLAHSPPAPPARRAQ